MLARALVVCAFFQLKQYQYVSHRVTTQVQALVERKKRIVKGKSYHTGHLALRSNFNAEGIDFRGCSTASVAMVATEQRSARSWFDRRGRVIERNTVLDDIETEM